MTEETPSPIASMTKPLAGTLMMTFVDQQLVGLDEPVATYLPTMRGIEVPRPLTARHLFTHTSGLSGHWGDEMNDLEESIALDYPRLAVGVSFIYDGAGNAVGGKIMETVSGEALAKIYKQHLLDPLGMTHTQVRGTSWDAQATAMDLAIFCQMVLNGGEYGSQRYFGPETAQAMRPFPIRLVLPKEPADSNRTIGIGWAPSPIEGLSPNTFGHGAASGSMLRVDPDNGVIIVMARDRDGLNYDLHSKQFLQAVAECVLNPATAPATTQPAILGGPAATANNSVTK